MFTEATATEEIREAVLNGMAVELFPDESTQRWFARIGILDHEIWGDTAEDVYRTLSQIVARH